MKRSWCLAATAAVAACVLALMFREVPLAAEVRTHNLDVDGADRTYRIVVPLERTRPTPIVFAFHGTGDSADSMADYSRLDRLSARFGFLLVYPSARDSMWATVEGDSSHAESNPDVRFFDRLVAHLTSVYDVDRNRIYLVGMSNGASFVHLLGAARSREVAALVAHSGARPSLASASDVRFPVMLVVGEEDPVSSSMQADADRYRSDGHLVKFIVVPGLGHAWSPRHNEEMWRFLSGHVRPSDEAARPTEAPEPHAAR